MKGAEGGNDRVHELTAGKRRRSVASKLPRPAHLYNRKKRARRPKVRETDRRGTEQKWNATYAQP
jgi:hypothetical protein